MPHRKRCKICSREMDCIKTDPKRYWCLSCNIEYHSDRPKGERWVDASEEGFGVREPKVDEEPTPTPTEVEGTQDNDSNGPEPDSADQGTLF